MSDLPKRLGSVVRELRRKRGLTQEELAERADLHRTTVANVEIGRAAKGGPSLDTIERIARALDLNVADLIAQAESRSSGRRKRESA